MKRHVYLLISVSCLSLGSVLSAQAGILPSETDLSSHTHNTHLVSQTKLLSLSQLSAQSEHRDFSAPIWQPLTDASTGSVARLELPEQDTEELGLTASVCFITDAGNCGGAGGGTDSSSSSGAGPIDPDTDNMCKLEGYVNTVCNATQDKGTLCPYDNGWHTGCTCKPEYNKACNGTDEQGKGTACNGKYKECCKKCTGYNYTASNIPTGHVKTGSCESCTGTKYKTKCDTNSSNTGTYVDCGSASGSGTSCKDDTGTYYTKCTCPTMYEWSASSKKCVCSTGYKYTCSGSNISGGEGNSCDGKYQKCKCKTGFTWSASSGMCVCNGTDWCTLNQNCASLGYKQQSCPELSIKCPFDTNYVYCISCPSKYKYTCSGTGYSGGSGTACGGKYTTCTCKSPYTWTNGACSCPSTYKYACSGTGYSGGSGTACGGKYTQCKCASGYKWDATSGTCKADRAVCAVGTLYYSDNTCSSSKVSGKTLLGVVIYSNGASGGGWVMTVKPIQAGIAWDMGSYYSTGITDKAVSASCTNTQKLVALGINYQAAITANNYKPTGTPSGKSWCLPSYDLLNNLNNSVNFAKVNAGITIAGGPKLGYGGQPSYSYEIVWSSSEDSNTSAWGFYTDKSGSFYMRYYDKSRLYGSYYSVRAVMEF